MIRSPLRSLALVFGLALPTALGCQAIIGEESLILDPLEVSCVLPSSGDAKMRFINVVPDAAHADFCVKPASAGAYKRPVLRGSGKECPDGLGYTDETNLVAYPSGKYDVKAVPNGSTGCNGPTLAEVKGVELTAERPVTVGLVVGEAGGNDCRLVALKDFGSKVLNLQVRLVSGLVGTPSVDFGFAADERLPSTVISRIGSVKPGELLPKGQAGAAVIEDDGYFTSFPAPYKFSASLPGSTDALFVHTASTAQATTVWLVGDVNRPEYPARALVCGDAAKGEILAPCTKTDLPFFTAESFNVGLYGAYAPYETERRTPLINALKTNDADFLCLTEIYEKADKDAVIAATKESGAFGYSATVDTDLDSPATDTRDLAGNAVEARTTPPCAASNPNAAAGEQFYQCMSKLGVAPIDNAGRLNYQGGIQTCVLNQGGGTLSASSSRDDRLCYDCLLGGGLSLQSGAALRDQCFQQKGGGVAFAGQTPTLLLSKLPIRTTEVFQLPSTMYRRAVLRAEVLPEAGGEPLDVYCAQLIPLFSYAVPYAGPYSPDPSKDGWIAEQQLQAKRAIDFIKERSPAGRRAIILTELAATEAAPAQGIDADNAATVQAFKAAFQDAFPAGGTPACTHCTEAEGNTYGTAATSSWTLRSFLYNFDAGATIAAKRRYTESVPLLDATGKEVFKGPVSNVFSYWVQVRRR